MEAVHDPLKVCFVALHIYPCLEDRAVKEHIGGAEVQQATLGLELRNRGISVSYVVEDDGVVEARTSDGFDIWPSYKPSDGIKGLRFFYPRVPAIWRAMRKAKADVYIVRGAGYLVGLAALFAMLNRCELVYWGASDSNFNLVRLKELKIRDLLLYRFGLQRASAIVVQTVAQKRMLMDELGLDGTVIPNIVPKIRCAHVTPRDTEDRNEILWIANFHRLKQPPHFLEVARSYPLEKFVMIGGGVSNQLETFEDSKTEASRLPNVSFLGYKSFSDTERHLDGAKLLINTSIYEGFSNTFLQAWSRGIPVVSYVDPDGLISEHGLGKTAGNLAGLKQSVRDFLNWDKERARHISEFCDSRFGEAPVDSFCRLLDQLVGFPSD